MSKEPEMPEGVDPDDYAVQPELYSFDSRAQAQPNCKYCHGVGQVFQKRLDGNMRPVWCVCTRKTQLLEAAEIRITEIFPGRLGRMRIANYDPSGNKQNEQALKVGRQFVKHWPKARENGWILGFHGESSAGKTHLAVGISIACVKKYMIKPYFLSMPRMLQLQRDSFNAEKSGLETPLDKAINADLLVIDDLGAEYIKSPGDGRVSWAEDFLYQVLDQRIILDRPIIYTTNYTKSGMKNLPMRIYERIARNQLIAPLEVAVVAKKSRVNVKDKDLLLGDD